MADMTGHDEATVIVRRIKQTEFFKALASVLLALGVAVLGVAMILVLRSDNYVRQDNRDLRLEQQCRFAISTEVSTISDRIDVITAEIFVQAIVNPEPEGNQPKLVALAAELDEQIRLLEPAIEERTKALETCNEGT